MGIGQALGFVGATVVLVGMPGPNNIYISLRSLTQGRRAGVISAFAIETGSIVYILLATLGRVFRDGVLVNLLNPKAALFFLAFLPQFTSRGAGTGQVRDEMLLLGLAVLVIGLTLDLCYALGADAIGRRVRTGGRFGGLRKYVVAGIYLTIAAVAAVGALP